MRSSSLQKILGVSPKAKILEHLLVGSEFDYTIADIHESTQVSRVTIQKVLEELVTDKLVEKTRKLGTSQLYRINKNDIVVKKLLELLKGVVKKQEELMIPA